MADSTQQQPAVMDFLEARIAEDEASIRSVNPSDVEVYYDGIWVRGQASSRRLEAECEAKRAIIADNSELVSAVEELSAALPGGLNQDPEAPWRTAILRRIAAVYKDHPDYQQEWAN